MRCRLVYLIGQLGAGGQERQLYYLLKALDRKRYLPAVIVWNFNERDMFASEIKKLGVPLHYFPVGAAPIAKLGKLYALIGRLRPEVVHSYSFYTNFAAWVVTLRTKIIGVGSIRNSFFFGWQEVGKIKGSLSTRWPRHQICNSHSASAEARQANKLFAPAKVYAVTNSVDLQQFCPQPRAYQSPVQLGAIGSLEPRKRWDVLLQAVRELKARGLSFRLRIAGAGPLFGTLSRQIQQENLEDVVHLLGPVVDVAKLLAESNFLVHTAEVEGYPNAVIEAMASGRAVVSTDAGDVPYIVDDGLNGFVVKRGDHNALVERMAQLITNPALCRTMGKAGRAKAEREFTIERLVEQTLAVYKAAGWKAE
jgi:glycosyltransferase involved in cell wall biosynthesis